MPVEMVARDKGCSTMAVPGFPGAPAATAPANAVAVLLRPSPLDALMAATVALNPPPAPPPVPAV